MTPSEPHAFVDVTEGIGQLGGGWVRGASVQRFTRRHPREPAVAYDGQFAAIIAPDVEERLEKRDEPSRAAEAGGADKVVEMLRHASLRRGERTGTIRPRRAHGNADPWG